MFHSNEFYSIHNRYESAEKRLNSAVELVQNTSTKWEECLEESSMDTESARKQFLNAKQELNDAMTYFTRVKSHYDSLINQTLRQSNVTVPRPEFETPSDLYSFLHVLIQPNGPDKNVCPAQEVIDTSSAENPLTIPVPRVGDYFEFLYSQDVFDTEARLGIELPVTRLLKIQEEKTIFLIGPGGCGKTRTCFDLCRHVWGLFFDGSTDADFQDINRKIESRSRIKESQNTPESQTAFEEESARYIKCLFAARILVLKYLIETSIISDKFDWLCLQRCRESHRTFSSICHVLMKQPQTMQDVVWQQLSSWFLANGGRIIFDEMKHLNVRWIYDYHPPHVDSTETNGYLKNRRSIFSFLKEFIMQTDFDTLWCLRTQDKDMITSASKDSGIYIFTDFTFLTPFHIHELLCLWIADLPSTDLPVVEQISNFLQGRPQFFFQFPRRYVEEKNLRETFETYVTLVTTERATTHSSLHYFWQSRSKFDRKSPMKNNDVAQLLIKLWVSYLSGDASSISYSENIDLVTTCLALVSKKDECWFARMTEPVVLTAGINFLCDLSKDQVMKLFSAQLFAPLGASYLTLQERDHLMKLLIAIRFEQGWWTDPDSVKCLPIWMSMLSMPHHSYERYPKFNRFVQQLQKSNFQLILFPAEAYNSPLAVFCVHVNTDSTDSGPPIFVKSNKRRKKDPVLNCVCWKQADSTVQEEIKSIENLSPRFLHIEFEFPFENGSKRKYGAAETKSEKQEPVFHVTPHSSLGKAFFGETFVQDYITFVSNLVPRET